MPIVVTRGQWGARPPAFPIPQTSWTSRTGFVVHYSAASKTQTVRAIQDYHIGKGWGDVGYNWLVTVDGRVWEGRQGTWTAVGAHARGHNTATIGCCMIGTDADVTDAAKASIRWLYDTANRLAGKTLVRQYHSGLSGAATSCPGNRLRAWVTAGMPTSLGGDDMALSDIVPVTGNRTVGTVLSDLWAGEQLHASGFVPTIQTTRQFALSRIEKKLDLIAAKVDIDPTELAAITAAARAGAEAGVLAAADELVTAILAGLPEGVLTRADVEAAIRTVLGGLDAGQLAG